jgi:hypothetical protein
MGFEPGSSEPPAPKGLKICVPPAPKSGKTGGAITIPPCKKGYTEKEVSEL